jgi:MHS family citrate/tricarballylate:H+ symporter-like MFS transporter
MTRDSPSAISSPTLKGVAAVAAGNALAFYDFQTFGFFAVQIGHAFFPGSSSAHALLLTLATFGVGFVARPLGAIVIGTYADRAGRKPAMVLSFGLMGLAVVAVALTPSAAKIGVAAPILLVIFRLLQGFAVGGEVGPAIAYLVEAAPPHRRSLFTSVQSTTQGASILAAGAVGFCLANTLSAAIFDDWGWRIALLVGGLILPLGFYIRRNLAEGTPDAKSVLSTIEQPQPIPGRVIVAGILLLGALTIANYVRTYITTFAQDSLRLATNLAFGVTVAQGLGVICTAPLAGLLSDKFGRKRVALWALPFCAAISIPGFMVMAQTHLTFVIYAATFAMSAIGTLISVPAITLIAESLPKASRAGALAILYAATIAVFGGSTQLVVKWLTDLTGSLLAPAWYQTGALLIGGAAIAFLRETVPRRGPTGAATHVRAICHR